MSGMLPGVECARRRRLHRSDPTARSFCLYIRNLQSSLSSSSLLERSMLKQACPDENLGGAAREAKRRLDERFAAQLKLENKRKTKSLFRALWQQIRF
ncbi:hypothetical protein VNO77_24179 [Canavalia gladiata]|uniref:Uncharacterized protein n=1 Tax=Canavalia gladiata TaxID=3824 RepID=A0AAN9L5S8_CANGL